MRKLDVSAITTSIGFPVKSGTLTHLQLAYQEALGELGKAMAGSGYATNKVYVLNGCINGGSGANYVISPGSVFYNGEVYLVDAADFATTGSNVAVGVITTTYFPNPDADPVQFTDGVLRNVHQIRKMVIQPGLSGSGAGNYLDFIDVTKKIQGALGQITIWKYTGTLSTYFDGTGLGIHPYTFGWAICNGNNGTVDMSGLTPVGYKPTDPDFDTPYTSTGGSKTVTLSQGNLPAVGIGYKDTLFTTADNNAGTAANYQNAQAPAPGAGSRFGVSSIDGVSTASNNIMAQRNALTDDLGSGTAVNNMQPYRTVLYVQRLL